MLRAVVVPNADTGETTITVYGLGALKIANSDHPNFPAILAAIEDPEFDPSELEYLFDVGKAIERSFNKVADRISVRGETVYMDMEPVHSALTEQIIRFMNEGEDFMPLVNFMEKLQANPAENSRNALWNWLSERDFTITPDGDVIGYKGTKEYYAHAEGEHAGASTSGFTGHAFVDGIEYGAETHTYIPYPVGSVVEMPRSEVVDDRGVECSQGLHVGTYAFAQTYSDPTLLEVVFSPRDVVSVPNFGTSQKIRVCRLTVLRELDPAEGEDTAPLRMIPQPLDEEVEFWDQEMSDLFDSGSDEDQVIDPQGNVYTSPTEDEFTVMQQRAKRRRRNFVAYATKMGPWTLRDADEPLERLSWEV